MSTSIDTTIARSAPVVGETQPAVVRFPVAIIPDAIYLTNEAAEIARVEPSTIRAAVRRGIIKGRGRPFRIRGSELFKLVA